MYEQRIRDVEMGSFTPLVFSTFGGMGSAATVAYKRLASMLSTQRGQSYSSVVSWIRCSTSFSLLRSAVTCLRGARSHRGSPVTIFIIIIIIINPGLMDCPCLPPPAHKWPVLDKPGLS